MALILVAACTANPVGSSAPTMVPADHPTTPASVATATPRSVASPSSAPAPTTAESTPSQRPSSSPDPTPVRLSGALSAWTVLGRGEEAAWSPDSDRILLMAENDVRIVDEAGVVLDRFEADRGAWLDQDHVVLFNAQPAYANDGELFEAVVGSGEMRSIGPGNSWVLGSGSGMLAAPAHDGSTRIWDGTMWAATLNGYPIAWANDGTYLAVIHPNGSDDPGIEGALEVYKLASGQWTTSASAPVDLVTGYPVQFNPLDRDVAFSTFGEVHVMDVLQGNTRAMPTQDATSFAWRHDGTLVVAHRDSTVRIFELDGTETKRRADAGDAVQSSVDGFTTIYYVDDYPDAERPPITIVGTDTVETLEVTGTTSVPPVLAPDGRAVLMQVEIDGEAFVISGR
jgi:hypothetical protein